MITRNFRDRNSPFLKRQVCLCTEPVFAPPMWPMLRVRGPTRKMILDTDPRDDSTGPTASENPGSRASLRVKRLVTYRAARPLSIRVGYGLPHIDEKHSGRCAALATVMLLGCDMRLYQPARVTTCDSPLADRVLLRQPNSHSSKTAAYGSQDCSHVRALRGDVAADFMRRGLGYADDALLSRDATCTYDGHRPGHRQTRDVCQPRPVSRRAAFRRASNCHRRAWSRPARDHGRGRRVPIPVAGGSVPRTMVRGEL